MTRTVQPGWAAELWRRARFRFVLKFFGVTLFMCVFFVAYFHVLRHPIGPVTSMPLTALDRALPFQSGAFAAYVSLWVYVGIPTGLMLKMRDAVVYAAWIGAMCATGLLIFMLWPTAVPADWRSVGVDGHAGFALLQGLDSNGNACPSLHVASATFTALWVGRWLQRAGAPAWAHAPNWLWWLLIVHSTVATRQHVVLDVLGGVLLALPFAWGSLQWWRPGPR